MQIIIYFILDYFTPTSLNSRESIIGSIMEIIYQLTLIPIIIIAIFSENTALPFSTESIYFETLEMNGSKQVKDDGGQL